LGLAPGGAALACHGFDFMMSAWRDGEGIAHLVDASGRVLDAKRDTYDHAFVLMALGWLYLASRDARVADAIGRVCEFGDKRLRQPHEGYREDTSASQPRRQNPHMHLFEAFLSVYGATNEAVYLDRAKEILDLFQRRFFDSQAGVLREFFTDNLRP